MTDASMLPMPAGGSGGSINLVQAMLRVLTHHWWKILAIWAVLTGGMVYAIHVRIKPTYESFSLLRVDPPQRDLFGQGGISNEAFTAFLQTQVEVIKSPSVLSAALAEPKVQATSFVREAKDPETELLYRLQAGVVPNSYLIRVAMTSTQPSDAVQIINAVVQHYLKVAETWTSNKNQFLIARLRDYNRELSDKVSLQKQALMDLSKDADFEFIEPTPSPPGNSPSPSPSPRAMPSRWSLDRYKQYQGQIFETTIELMQVEALVRSRQAEAEARLAGVDPDQLLRMRIKEALYKDPEVANLLREIDLAERKVNQADSRARVPSDPSLIATQRQLVALKLRLEDLCARKGAELAPQLRGQIEGTDSLQELNTRIESLRVKRDTLEQLLSQIKVESRQQGTDALKAAFIHQDLATLKQMQDSIYKQIEQLQFDSRGEARIVQIDPARPSGVPVKDSRRKLWAMTPVGVIAMVLGLFLFLEIRSGRVADLDEVSRRVPVEVYPVPSLPGNRRRSSERELRANEAQLQDFLQSLDHLRVSLWFGKEAVAGSGRCLVVTSAIGGEGKTTLAAHLAVCCAKAGISTLVIDADLRRAALSRMFEEEQTPGLSDVLKGDMPPEGAVVALHDGGFHLLPAGSPGQHPGWLFREQRIGQVLARYRQMFDLVILDTPPVLPVADALSLGRWVDGAIMVIRYDVSRFPLVDRARRRLISAGIPILKTVVNGVKTSGYYRYGYGDRYGYGYGYGSRTTAADGQGPSSHDDGARGMIAGSREMPSA